jgi:hypothetical protein
MRKTEKAARGQTIRTEAAPTREKAFRNVSDGEALLGKKMGGGPRDTSHSLSSAGNTVDYTGTK